MNQQGFGGIFTGVGNRLNYQYNEINYRGANAFSNYNGVNVKFSGNNIFNLGIMLNANYTWSHSIDDLSSTFTDGNNGQYMLGYTNGFFPQAGQGQFRLRHSAALRAQRGLEHSVGWKIEQRRGKANPRRMADFHHLRGPQRQSVHRVTIART